MISDARPKLRRNLRFMRHENDGAISWVVKDPTALKYFRFGQVEAWLMQQMDGTRSLQLICDALHSEIGMRATPGALEVLVRRLKELGLVERSVQERSAMLMERVRTQRRLFRDGRNTILRIRWSFGDPDALLARMVKAMPFFWTPGFVLASCLAFILYAVLLALHWQPFAASIVALYSPSTMTLGLVLLAYGCFTVTAIIHEFGHGLTCKRFGGEVHEIGAMILYFAPAFYCNVSDAWTFENRAHRLWVTFAGGWIQLWCATIATVVWLLTEPGTFTNTVALFTGAMGGIYSLLFNYNPLIPLDGYYALIDWLEMPNLRARSFAYVGTEFRRRVFRLDVPAPTVTDRERRIFLSYGILSAVYTTLMLSIFAIFVGHWLIPGFGAWGLVVFLLLLFAVTKKPRAAVRKLLRVVLTEKLPRGRQRRLAVAAVLLVLAGCLAATITPWTVRATGTVTLEPQSRRWLRPMQGARLTELRVREGAAVRLGDTIAVLRDPELELERIGAVNAEQQLAVQAARARATGATATERAAEIELETVKRHLDVLERRRSELVLLAPFSGVFVTPRLEERLGEWISAGDSLVEVWRHGALRARVRVPQRLAAGIRSGSEVRMRFAARPSLTWRTRIDRVESAADGDDLVATAVMPQSDDHPLLPGMRGRASIDIARVTIAGALERAARRIIRLDLLL